MKKLPWQLRNSRIDLSSIGFPNCYVLLPESDHERAQIVQALDTQGVCNSMSFSKNSINGRIDFPADLAWEADGAVSVTITTSSRQFPGWFWVVECDDGSGRRTAWWSTKRDRDTAVPWE